MLSLSSPSLSKLVEEAGLISSLRHPNIVQARGVTGRGGATGRRRRRPASALVAEPHLPACLISRPVFMQRLYHFTLSLQFLGVCTMPAAVITERCARGSLTDVLRAARTDPAATAEMAWPRRLSLALDAARGENASKGWARVA